MKTKKEIQEVIEKLKRLREAMPRRNAFGDDNYGGFTQQIEALEGILALKTFSEPEVCVLRDEKELEDEYLEQERYQVFDWVLSDDADPLVDDGDLHFWEAKAKRGQNVVRILPPPSPESPKNPKKKR